MAGILERAEEDRGNRFQVYLLCSCRVLGGLGMSTEEDKVCPAARQEKVDLGGGGSSGFSYLDGGGVQLRWKCI